MIRFRKFLQLVFQMQPSCPISWKWKFWDFQVLGSKFVKFLMSILNWQINSSSIFGSFFIVMTHNFPVNFKLIHFQLIPIKVPILRLSSALVKICQIPYVIFGSTNQFSFKLFTNAEPSNIAPLYFLSSSIIYFGHKQPIKVQIFDIFECSCQNSKFFTKI